MRSPVVAVLAVAVATVSALTFVPSNTETAVAIQSTAVAATDPPMAAPVYRFWSSAYNGHFYTVSKSERDHIIANYPRHVWAYEGAVYGAFTSQVPGTVPLYRFWSSAYNGHFYTTSEAEKTHVINAYDDYTWKYETVAYYVYPIASTAESTRPVARFWGPAYRHHFYTASANEAASVKANYPPSIWTYETDAFRVPIAVPLAEPIPTPPVSFGNGTYRVGIDVPAGEYRSTGSSGCYWERLSGFGGTFDEILANDFASGPRLVQIKQTDVGFHSDRCGTWSSLSSHKPTISSQFSDGQFLVGVDISPGQYRTSNAGDCYWARLSALDGDFESIIANSFGSASTQLIQVSASDRAVESSDCGTWVRVG